MVAPTIPKPAVISTARTSPITIATVTWTPTRLGLEIVKGASEYAKDRGWKVMRVDNRSPLPVSVFLKRGVRGLIVQAFEDAPVDRLLTLGVPIINVSNSRAGNTLPRVVSDDLLVGRMAADYFIGKGFRRFAVCSDEKSGTAKLRERGYVERLREAGHQVSIVRGPYELSAAYLSLRTVNTLSRWLAKLEKPCGLFGWTDGVCDTVINLSREAGWKIPEELSILGVNNDFGRLVDDPEDAISSIQLDGHSVGYHAAQLIADMLAGGEAPKEPIVIPPMRIVERRSTDFYAVMDPAVLAALKYIKQNCQRPTSVEGIARAAMLSRRILEKRFHQYLHSSPYEEVMRCRLDRAKELLLGTNLKLEEIAHLCGYDDGSNFSIFFHERAGCSPSAFRSRGFLSRKAARAAVA